MTVRQVEAIEAQGARLFIERVRRGAVLEEAKLDYVLQSGDVLAVAGRRDELVSVLGSHGAEVDDAELLAVPAEGVDVCVSAKDVDGETLQELAAWPAPRVHPEDQAWPD
jgi:putative transport protein